MSEHDETLAEIVAGMRCGTIPKHRTDHELLALYADRIEAAHKREREELEEYAKSKMLDGATIIDNRTVGDAAAMREALVYASEVLTSWRRDAPLRAWAEYDEAISHARAALAKPPRNCDVGTEQEQQDRFREFCRRYESEGECGIGRSEAACPAFQGGRNPDCSLWWAQMPYEEGGAK